MKDKEQTIAQKSGKVEFLTFMQQGSHLYAVGIDGEGNRYGSWPATSDNWEPIQRFVLTPINRRKEQQRKSSYDS